MLSKIAAGCFGLVVGGFLGFVLGGGIAFVYLALQSGVQIFDFVLVYYLGILGMIIGAVAGAINYLRLADAKGGPSAAAAPTGEQEPPKDAIFDLTKRRPIAGPGPRHEEEPPKDAIRRGGGASMNPSSVKVLGILFLAVGVLLTGLFGFLYLFSGLAGEGANAFPEWTPWLIAGGFLSVFGFIVLMVSLKT